MRYMDLQKIFGFNYSYRVSEYLPMLYSQINLYRQPQNNTT